MTLFYDLRLGVIPCGDHRVYVLLQYACEDVGGAVPRWSVVALGSYEQVARHAFALAGDCELTHLRNAMSLHMRAEDMLGMWRAACRMPLEMADAVVRLWIGDDDRAPVQREAATQALDALRDVGYAQFAGKLEAGEASLQLWRDIKALVALYGARGPLCPSRLPCDASWYTRAQPARAHVLPGTGKWPITVCCYVLSGQTLVVQLGQEAFAQVHRSMAIRDFVTGAAYGLEMELGRSAQAMVAKFRSMLKDAPALPEAAVATVCADREVVRRAAWDAELNLSAFADRASLGDVAGRFCVRLGTLSQEARMALARLEPKLVEWSVPAQGHAVAA